MRYSKTMKTHFRAASKREKAFKEGRGIQGRKRHSGREIFGSDNEAFWEEFFGSDKTEF